MPRDRGDARVIAAPFEANDAIARRISELTHSVGEAVKAEIEEIVRVAPAGALDGSTIPVQVAGRLVTRHGLASTRELALLALPVALAMARPPISSYRVAAVGIEAGSGYLVLGANLEFPGTDLGTTVHAEGFVALRARRRGRGLETLAVRVAHPCAHCRQTLAESAAATELLIIDPLGHELSLDALYPWSFGPGALNDAGDVAGLVAWPALAFVDPERSVGVDPDAAVALLYAGARAHAPYSRAPSAVALRLRDGRLLSAGCVESVAFNPTITALQAALVEVAAARAEPDEIVDAWLGRQAGGAVDPEPGFRSLLRTVAPGARSTVLDWRIGP